MIRKLQIKFVIINMTIVTVMLCIIFGMVYSTTKGNLESQSIGMMKAIAAEPSRLGRLDEPLLDLQLPYFTVELSLNGELISTGGGYYDLSDRDFLRNIIEKSVNTQRETGILEQYGLRFYRVTTPLGTVLVFSDMSSETNMLDTMVRNSILIGILSFFGFLIISIFLARWAVKPVDAAWKEQKRFVADASHELKTPLTVIMTNAELLQSDTYTETERNAFSQSILTMSYQMKGLVEKLLELARSDTQSSGPPMAPVALSELVSDAAISFEGIFFEKGLALESTVEPDITIMGNEQALQQLADILLDNAQKYSAPGGISRVCLMASGRRKCRLTVSSPGEEIPPEDLQKIFQRFYRRDHARSRDGSFGLGLSIAQSIVVQHKGRIWAESKNGRNTFFVELPGR